MAELSERQLAELEQVWGDLQREPDAGETPETEDVVCRAGLDAWLAGVVSTGRLTTTSLDDLLDVRVEARDHPVARSYMDRVVAIVLPNLGEEALWYTDLAVTVREHCRQRGYLVSDGTRDRFGYRTWHVEVPGRGGHVQLAFNGEVFLLNFPGGFTWPEFAYEREDAIDALQDQLRLVDSYASPATRTVTVQRALRSPRLELHLSDGTVLWRRGGRRARK